MNPPHQMKTEEIEKLVTASKQGNSGAFGALYDHFVTPIYRYIYYRTGKQNAEDLTELVFLKTWENIGQYQPFTARPNYKKSASSFSSWIFRIAHNIVIDHYRSARHENELSESIEDHRKEAYTPGKAVRHFDQEILSEGMAELKDHYRQVLILKYINELDNEEIAEIMGRSQAALRILQFRALKSLKKILQRKGIAESDI